MALNNNIYYIYITFWGLSMSDTIFCELRFWHIHTNTYIVDTCSKVYRYIPHVRLLSLNPTGEHIGLHIYTVKVIYRNLKLGGIDKCLGGVCKHVQSANSLRKFTETFKTETNPLSWGGVVSQLGGGVFTPLGGVSKYYCIQYLHVHTTLLHNVTLYLINF